jgi:hypothetical protein
MALETGMMQLKHPLPGARITQGFGANATAYARYGLRGHEGLDYSAAVGTPVRAAHDGDILRGQDEAGYGTYAVVSAPSVRTLYGHLSAVTAMGRVTAGQVIGLSGNTGNSTGPHLHFGVRPVPIDWQNGYKGYVDPEPWLAEQEDSMAVSKLGVHYQNNPELGTEATEVVRGSRIGWVKGIDPDYWPTPAAEMFPGKRVVARLWIGGDAIERNYVLRGSQGANDYVNRLAPRYSRIASEGVRDVLGPNEMHPDAGSILAHVAFWQRWAERMVTEYGLRPWFGSFGVGWPGEGQIREYAGVARYCAQHGGGMEVHEYGAPSVLDGNGWYTLRYRRTIAELSFEAPVLVGECGIDWGVTGQKPTGWQSHQGYVYPEQYGLPQGVMNEERYWRQLSAYDDELCRDGYVVAATPFVTCPTADWKTFDVGGSLLKRIAAKHGSAPEPPVDIEQQIGEAMQAHIIPLNPNAALEKAGAALGLLPASSEVRDVAGYVAQAFRSPGEREWQHIAYCIDGDWAKVTWFRREN